VGLDYILPAADIVLPEMNRQEGKEPATISSYKKSAPSVFKKGRFIHLQFTIHHLPFPASTLNQETKNQDLETLLFLIPHSPSSSQ
jgi:hypothetical protein